MIRLLAIFLPHSALMCLWQGHLPPSIRIKTCCVLHECMWYGTLRYIHAAADSARDEPCRQVFGHHSLCRQHSGAVLGSCQPTPWRPALHGVLPEPGAMLNSYHQCAVHSSKSLAISGTQHVLVYHYQTSRSESEPCSLSEVSCSPSRLILAGATYCNDALHTTVSIVS